MVTDSELARRLAADDGDAFADLVRAYQHRLFAFALAMTGSAADAEEIAQDAFVRAHRALKGYDARRISELRLSGWLHRIALNVVRNRARGRAARARVVELDADRAVDNSAGPERTVLARAELRELARLVARLPDAQRSAVTLRCVQGMSYVEVAELLGLSAVTVRTNVHRGLAALRSRVGWLSEVS